MLKLTKTAFKNSKLLRKTQNVMNSAPTKRNFAAMDQIDFNLFEHDFTNSIDFRDKAEKFKCFRVMDEEGNIITPGYDDKIDTNLLLKMYDNMVTINEADQVYNAAQRQARISFYMTQLGEEASGIGSAAALKDHDLIFPQYREAGCFLWRGFSI